MKSFSQTVSFSKDSIIINSKLCMHFQQSNDTSYIYSLDDKKLIQWQVKPIGGGKFSTTYFFPGIEKTFHKANVNGRNAIIMALVQFKVIEDCTLYEKRLLKFIEKFNEE
ncbi:hypothetical protein [Ferruginibacter albus]|uniref:hypothetical protein n=1 Tax=Ferruginibacter albus TaxID=2875540 RepID=UPI001CC49867|nr:hypothetical protein [Ferruginibacter albus]UAY53585.1 hypothetical protein K9M53_07940 [Ferruginibacter albus]